MSLRELEDQTVTVANTEYFKVKRNVLSRKQQRTVATNKKLKAKHAVTVAQAKMREAKSGIAEYVPEPQYVLAPVPMTLVRAVPKPLLKERKMQSYLKRTDKAMGIDPALPLGEKHKLRRLHTA